MRSFPRVLCRHVLLPLMALTLSATTAFAQTLSGRFVETLPGGPLDPTFGFAIYEVEPNGETDFIRTLGACVEPATVDCIRADGTFTVEGLTDGPHLVRLTTSAYLASRVSAIVAGATNMGDIAVIRTPFELKVTVGDIPATGGSIPVTAQLKALWALPAVSLTARFIAIGSSTHGDYFHELASQNFTWSGGLGDTGPVPLAPIVVAPSEPAGAQRCVLTIVHLQGQPEFVVAFQQGCGLKRP